MGCLPYTSTLIKPSLIPVYQQCQITPAAKLAVLISTQLASIAALAHIF
jgi:hypothetical protein